MSTETFAEVVYRDDHECVSWKGVALRDCAELRAFLRSQARDRLEDAEATDEFHQDLGELPLSGVGTEDLEEFVQAEPPDPKTWEAGEALAEAWLTEECGVFFPWNSQRDKRTPRSSLPGADLVGWVQTQEGFRLVVGEVKTSREQRTPPSVMSGPQGMEDQLTRLTENNSNVRQILLWLHPRVSDTHRQAFESCLTAYFNSGRKSFMLLGLLIRDTPAIEADVSSLGRTLRGRLDSPTICHLTAIYLPWPLQQLVRRITGRSGG